MGELQHLPPSLNEAWWSTEPQLHSWDAEELEDEDEDVDEPSEVPS